MTMVTVATWIEACQLIDRECRKKKVKIGKLKRQKADSAVVLLLSAAHVFNYTKKQKS